MTQNDIRPTKKDWSKDDWFRTDPLMGAKKLARNIFEAKVTMGWSKNLAALQAVKELHRRLPEFISVWELEYRSLWREHGKEGKKGDYWLAGRINHQSKGQENKQSHMRLEKFIRLAAMDNAVYTWIEWEELIQRNIVDALPIQYLYLLPFSRNRLGHNFDIQKVGITTSTYNRYQEHKSRGPRGVAVKEVVGLWPADNYLLTCKLGRMLNADAEKIEDKCKAAIGNGEPALYGSEWFETNPVQALAAVLGVLQKLGFKPVVYEEIMSLKITVAPV